jgi:catechol 2,3-dioxygenase-like lactoylglutathione lyase family enzyme
MKLELLYVPTSNLSATLAVYRDGLGFTEVWREGETTAAVTLAGSGIQVMLDQDPDAPAGPMFTVDSVAEFHATRPAGLTVLSAPAEIPGGFLALYADPGGSTFYVIDQSSDQ